MVRRLPFTKLLTPTKPNLRSELCNFVASCRRNGCHHGTWVVAQLGIRQHLTCTVQPSGRWTTLRMPHAHLQRAQRGQRTTIDTRLEMF
jgi:hypothetical protein